MEPLMRILFGLVAAVCLGRSLVKLFAPQPKPWKRVLLYILLEIAITLPSWVGDENPILFFPFFMLGFLLLLTGEKLPKLVVGAVFFALLIPLNMLLDSRYWGDGMLCFILLGKTLAWCALALFLSRLAPEGGLRLSKRLWILLGGLTLGPLMAMMSFSIWGNNFQTDAEYQFYSAMLQRFSYTILPFVMISALALLIAAVLLSRHEVLEQESKLAALREVYYAGLKQEQRGLRTLRHDLRNHVTALQGLLEQGKQTALSHYLADLAGSPALEGGKRYAQNETANVVLCSKASQMGLLELLPDFAVSLPEVLALSELDLCALLGNALDNAIEGAAAAEDKTIALRCRLEKGMFMLQVQNAIGGAVHADLSSTKADAKQHGYGLAGMREIATRHGGSLEAVAKDGRFTLLICFPCGEECGKNGCSARL